MNKILLLLAGMFLPALGFAQGNGNYQQTSLGSPGHTLAGTTVNGCSTGAVGHPCALVDSRWAARSLKVDAANYGVRAVSPFVAPAIAGITAKINSGSSTAFLSAASTFQNGDGVVIYGAGATNTMSTPAAPTVTPSLSASETGSLLDVAAPAGGAQYCYQVVARDVMGGLTAASRETCTATGSTTLGSRTNSVSSITMANNIVTVTTSAAHGLAVGAMFNMAGVTVNGSTFNAFNGWFIVATSSDNTHFTYATLSDTRGGAPSSGSSGTITYWQNNHITWTAITGAFQYYIYGRVTGGSKTLIGVSWPQDANVAGDATYLGFDDYGSTVTTYPNPPNYVPVNPPAVATNDMLSTTIAGGAGTTRLTLAGTASSTATNGTILFDDAVTFLAAVNAANANFTSVVIPASGTYVFNSPITIPAGTSVIQRGIVHFNETITMSGASWTGETEKGTYPSFAYSPAPQMTINKANPGIFTVGTANLYTLTIANLGTNGANMIIMDAYSAIPAGTFKDINFVLNNGTDYMNMALVTRGTHIASGAVWNFDNILLLASQNGNLTACTPAIYFDNGANPKFNNLFMSGKGVLLRPTQSGSYLEADAVYSQGNYEPLFTFTNAWGGGTAGITAKITNVGLDTTFLPVIANLGGVNAGLSLRAQIEMTQGVANLVTGVPSTSIVSMNSFPYTQNTSLETSTTSASVSDGTFGRTSIGMKNLFSSVDLGTGFSIFTTGPTPAKPTCGTPTGGGSVPAGTWFYAYTTIYANGSEANYSLTCNATTGAGNFTIPLTWTATPGAIGYNIYRGPAANNLVLLSCSTPATVSNSYNDAQITACGPSPVQTAASGPAGIINDTVWANNFTLGPSAAPTGATNLTKLYMDSTLNWPSFKPNGNTSYALLGFNGGISPSVQTKRVTGCATIESMNATCDTTVTWPNAFGDTSYTAVCSGEGVSSGVPIIQGIDIWSAKTTSYISVRTLAITAAAAQFTTIDCTAVHD